MITNTFFFFWGGGFLILFVVYGAPRVLRGLGFGGISCRVLGLGLGVVGVMALCFVVWGFRDWGSGS